MSRRKPTPPNPGGLCLCGCGQTTSIATKTDRHQRRVRGEHVRFVVGHHPRGLCGPPADVPADAWRCANPGCRWPLRACTAPPRRGFRAHQARNLCARCHIRARRDGWLDRFPRLVRRRDEVLNALEDLRGIGYSDAQVAAHLGISADALRLHLTRAARDGDPRVTGLVAA
ncbi:hypothetical protein ACFQE5_22105 [Pseudonocardia hispaniensis]|uniref:Sigma-70-like protein n=1 Tax=Pseudonocardia hispaniensis TaxID=904933 RepID=A0ABW1J8Z2_9PSEU